MRSDDRLLDLLAARATEGLNAAESEELDRALAGHDDPAGDDMEIAAAAIYLAFDAAAVASVARHVQTALERSVHALLARDRQASAETILGDLRINRETRAIDRRCHAFVARHLPTAGILRYVSSVLRLNIALERIGDYATTIARTVPHLSTDAPPVVKRDIEMMVGHEDMSDPLSLKRRVERSKVVLVERAGVDDCDLPGADDVDAGSRVGEWAGIVSYDPANARAQPIAAAIFEIKILDEGDGGHDGPERS